MKIKSVIVVLVFGILVFAILVVTTSRRNLDSFALSAKEIAFQGIATDETGKPLRGAIVKASAGYKSVSCLTDQGGRFRLADLAPGNYEISVTAWGYAPWTETRKISAGRPIEMNVKLERNWEVRRLSTTDWLTFLPEDKDLLALEATCLGCHSFNPIINIRGLTAAQWRALIKNMGTSFIIPQLPEPRLVYTSKVLEKHFGPNSPTPRRDQVQPPVISDAALQATYREYVIPTQSKPHSLTADSKGNIWFTEYDYFSNKIGRFDIQTETFQEYPVPTPRAAPHTLAVAKDGKVWITMNGSSALGVVDPRTGKITEYPTPTPQSGPLIPVIDSAGNIWFTEANANKVAKFDPRTEKFQEFPVPVPKAILEDTSLSLQTVAGEPIPETIRTFPYGITVDSQDKIWFSQYNLGKILKLDPTTGKFTEYRVPGLASTRGIGVDSKDNVWFVNFLGHKLGKLNPKTGEIRQYQSPTRHAAPYGRLVAKNGHIWVSDFSGNQIIRFNPQTEKFTEYPIPTFDAISRFMGEDPQGRIWFSEFWTGKIGSVDPGETPARTTGASPTL